MNIKIVENISEKSLNNVVNLIYDAFELKFKHIWLFTKNEDKIKTVIKESININSGLYAWLDGEVLGFIGLKDKEIGFLKYNYRAFKKAFGLVGGTWRYFLNKLFTKYDTQPEFHQEVIELIVVSPKARGLGIGSILMDKAQEYAKGVGRKELILEVVDSNPKAKKLYERLGFYEFDKKDLGPLADKAGFSSYFYMAKSI